MELQQKRFTKNDSGFVCANCGATVEPLGFTSRNHCPKCLCSLHVDLLPGDRANPCGGIMDAVCAVPDAQKGFILIHQCRKCGALCRNRAALTDHGQGDDRARLIALTARPLPDEPKKKGCRR